MSKFKQAIARLTTRRPADRKIDPASNWTTNAWADLPVYHPRELR